MTSHYRRPDVRQEDDLVPWRRILAIAFAVVTIFVILGLWSWMILRDREAELRPAGRRLQPPEEPAGARGVVAGVDRRIFVRRETGEEGLGTMLNRQKREELRRFGWADRSRGLVQIPIDDAMNLVVEESR
ncbi:hypothetical protein SOCE26_056000 [Sorangium cellulosum]|uniref:Uncharacterized protein n=1 Tax=Sorangium cellulosum TaxID=56 RepID=A0A2L0EXW0_SORCE|nr:hypothetical protein [Sorangium cellulosum]AUX44138.1 hypothetical protein SOCE26_056000 [Sorangium cellulosum]